MLGVPAGGEGEAVDDEGGGPRWGWRRRGGGEGAELVDEVVEGRLVQAALEAVAEEGAEGLALADAFEEALGEADAGEVSSMANGASRAAPWARWALRRSAAALAWVSEGAWMKPGSPGGVTMGPGSSGTGGRRGRAGPGGGPRASRSRRGRYPRGRRRGGWRGGGWRGR